MQDIEVINRFKRQISWGDETELIVDGSRTYMAADNSLYIPMHWSEQDYARLIVVATIYNREAIALVWGEPSKATALELCEKLIRSGLALTFIDPDAKVATVVF